MSRHINVIELRAQSESVEKEIKDLKQSRDFYKRRCDALQKLQSKMREPERTIVCDILANGKLLYKDMAGDRYGDLL